MAVTVTTVGTNLAKAATGTSVATTASVGDWIIVTYAGDVLATNAFATGADAGGGSLSLTQAGTGQENTGNVCVSVWYGQVLTAITAQPVGASGGSSQSSAITVYKVTGLDASPVDRSTGQNGTSGSPSSGATATLSQADELVIGVIGMEGPGNDTSGSWTTGANNVSGNQQDAGTIGGGATSNITISAVAEVVSATTA